MGYFKKRLFWIVVTASISSAIYHPAMLQQAWGAAGGVLSSIVSDATATPRDAAPVDLGVSAVSVGFSPGNAESLVVRAIDRANRSIDMAAYSFTSKPIASALVRAAKRGVAVRAVLDKSQRTERYSSATFLANAGVPVRIDSRYAIMHNKFLVIDGHTVETGSFNFTSSAAHRNAENVLILKGVPAIAAQYEREWQRLWAESAPYAARY